MMKIYTSTTIESAEQAEALPIGTTATNEATTGSGTWYAPPRVNIGRGMWSGDDLYRSSDMIGWTALVPIEAEDGTVTVLAPEPEDLGAVVREAVTEVLDERERKAEEEATAREERDQEVSRRLQEMYLDNTLRHAGGFITPDRAS